MKSGFFHSKRIVIFLLPVLFLNTISILSAQKKFIGNSIPESVGYINNFSGSLPENMVPEMPVWSHPEVHADSENFVKRDSVYTYILYLLMTLPSIRKKYFSIITMDR